LRRQRRQSFRVDFRAHLGQDAEVVQPGRGPFDAWKGS
jgi:hypothetical protein